MIGTAASAQHPDIPGDEAAGFPATDNYTEGFSTKVGVAANRVADSQLPVSDRTVLVDVVGKTNRSNSLENGDFSEVTLTEVPKIMSATKIAEIDKSLRT